MRIPKILAGITLSLLLGAAGANLDAQSAKEMIVVTTSDDMMVGKTLLPKGEYQIINVSPVSPVLQFFSNDRLRYEANALPSVVHVQGTVYAKDTALVLEKIGDRYYLREIWVRGRDTGLEIQLPERAKRLKRELELASNRGPERLVVLATVAR
jgi:hypothetical protein